MPELPEVETIVRALRQPLIGRTITGVWSLWPRHIVKPDLPQFEQRISGQRIQAVDRRGKFLIFTLSQNETVIIHLKMSGHLSVVAADEPMHKHVRTVFKLDNGQQLRFQDQRKFGRVYLVHDLAEVVGQLGPEPLDKMFTAELLQTRLAGHRRAIKPLLLDQAVVAGVGNIYADESLFYAGIHPERQADSLETAEIHHLHAAIQKSLRLGIERQGASIDLYYKPDGSKGEMQDYFAVYGQTHKPCSQCGTPIRRMTLGGRGTHFCPHCQK